MNPADHAATVQRSITRIRRCRGLIGLAPNGPDVALLAHVIRAAYLDADRAGMGDYVRRVMPK